MYIIKVKSRTISSARFEFGNSMRIFTISYCKGNKMKVTKNKLHQLTIIRNTLTFYQNKSSWYMPSKETGLSCKLSEYRKCENFHDILVERTTYEGYKKRTTAGSYNLKKV